MAQLFYYQTEEKGFPKEYISTAAIIRLKHIIDSEGEHFTSIKLSEDRNIVVQGGATATANLITSVEPIVQLIEGFPKNDQSGLYIFFV